MLKNIPKYQCPFCSEKFRYKVNLKAHLRESIDEAHAGGRLSDGQPNIIVEQED